VRDSVNADNNLYAAVEAYGPKFVLYYGVPAGSAYQVGMWIEYLERIGEPFIVVLRKTSAFREIVRLTDAPVVVRTNIWQLDDVVTPSITTAFYVNNSAPNVHMVRYPQMTHVQLLHGDSDKASSFNPVTALYDKVFVAGQAAIDRYENNGVDIPSRRSSRSSAARRWRRSSSRARRTSPCARCCTPPPGRATSRIRTTDPCPSGPSSSVRCSIAR
jgi:hypothetical protein